MTNHGLCHCLQLMSGLVSIALANEVFQAEVNQRVEAMAALRRRRDGVAGDEVSDDEVPQESLDGAVLTPAVSTAGDAQAELPPSSGWYLAEMVQVCSGVMQQMLTKPECQPLAVDLQQALQEKYPSCPKMSAIPSSSKPPAFNAEPKSSPEDWLEWIHSNRLGLRRALGEDCRGRRYWALGRLSGCFRVYVEAENGHDWGWYEGKSLTVCKPAFDLVAHDCSEE